MIIPDKIDKSIISRHDYLRSNGSEDVMVGDVLSKGRVAGFCVADDGRLIALFKSGDPLYPRRYNWEFAANLSTFWRYSRRDAQKAELRHSIKRVGAIGVGIVIALTCIWYGITIKVGSLEMFLYPLKRLLE